MGRFVRYFSIEGRASRLEYWRFQQTQALVAALILIMTVPATLAGGWLGAIPFSLIVPLLIATVCVVIRRLHDRGLSARWVALFMLGPFALAALAAPLAFSGKMIPVIWILSLSSVGLAIWGFVEVGVRRGTKGENRFGPEPV